METFIIVFSALFAGLSVADPPDGVYTAEGVDYVGCFEHGRDWNPAVLQITVGECTLNTDGPCLTPATCIESCQSINTTLIYIGLKFPGQCFCDYILRGVNQTDSENGEHCDGYCVKDEDLDCGRSYYMLVYQWNSSHGASGSTKSPTERPPTKPPDSTSRHSTRPSMTDTESSPGSSSQTSKPTQRLTSESSISLTTSNMANMRNNTVSTALIAGAAGGGSAVLLVVSGVVAFVMIRKRSSNPKKSNQPTAAINLDEVRAGTAQVASGNLSFQSNNINVDALYAKPDKKKRNQQQPPNTPNPDDPAYQDVMPTGAQHQYATVQDEPSLYDSIQDDPQYATVQKGRKHVPDVETNPLYGRGSVDNTAYDPEGPLSNDNDRAPSVCEMMDNIIYE